jgi:general secretion pathway protein A
MYCEHFGLETLPFRIAPDPAFLCENNQNRHALKMLQSDLQHLGAISVVSGDVGTGKTTLILNALKSVPESIHVGLLSNFPGWADDILPWVLGTFDIPDPSDERSRIDAFWKFVEEERNAGRKVILIVDEAQNVSSRGFEQLRRLTTLGPGSHGYFKLILVGQKELSQKLEQPECLALSERVETAISLGPMSEEETDAYIRHRLKRAGGAADIFDADATSAVHQISGGYPRLVNLICDTAMVVAYSSGDRFVRREVIQSIGAYDTVLSHLPHVVHKARQVTSAARQPKTMRAAVSEAAEVTTSYLQGDFFEFVPMSRGDSTPDLSADPRPEAAQPLSDDKPRQDFSTLLKPDASGDADRGSHDFEPVSKASDTPKLGPRPKQRRAIGRAGGWRRTTLMAFGALAASLAAVVLTSVNDSLIEESAVPKQFAASRTVPLPAPTAAASVETSGPAPPLDDMPGELFLERALANGVTDPGAAAIDYARAALRGEDLAAYYLGQLYEVGDGVPRNLSLARGWYASVAERVRGARQRLEGLAPPSPAGVLGAPQPVLGGELKTGGGEFVWVSGEGTDPAYYYVEISPSPSAEPTRLPPQDTSALMAEELGDARFWRVIAVSPDAENQVASGWVPFGHSDGTEAPASGDVSEKAIEDLR